MLQQIEGSQAVAQTIAYCRPEVICAYPISPQTHIVEKLSQIVKKGELGSSQFINVESEFAAMSVCIGASAAGARTYTATASQGLLYMAEPVYNVYTGELGGTVTPTAAQLGLEPPRFCAECGRRMVVQVRPDGWRARCSRHGEVDSADIEAQR